MAGIVLATWLLTTLACSRSFGSPDNVAATQWANSLTAVVPPTSTVDPTAVQPSQQGGAPQVESQPETTPTPGEPVITPSPLFKTPTVETSEDSVPVTLYYTQAGDTLPALAVRFGVEAQEITSPDPIPETTLISPNQLLVIPNRLDQIGPSQLLMPDSEVVHSPSTVGFDIDNFVSEAGGYLSTYKQYLPNKWYTGAQIIQQVAIENSVNPRLLLSLLEYKSGWVYADPETLADQDYPLGYHNFAHKGLYRQLNWAVQQLNIGYYGWRNGQVTQLTFPDGSRTPNLRMAPELNAGTVALQYLLSQIYNESEWGTALFSEASILTLHTQMFGDPWQRAQTVEPLYPSNITQPVLELPFLPGKSWAFSGGPHSAWGPNSALAALDFAPSSVEGGCVESNEWVTASASGLVMRAGDGVLVLDLDGDGYEQTGWVLLYMHVATKGRIEVGSWVDINYQLGHPSCEGGQSTGTHVHVARKYNGEWILADGPLPFQLSGWTAHAGSAPYLGTLTKDDQIVNANVYGSADTLVTRPIEVSTEP